jgi:hypothetical protein
VVLPAARRLAGPIPRSTSLSEDAHGADLFRDPNGARL